MKTPWHSGALHEAVKLMPKRADAVSGVCRPCFGRNWAIILTSAYCWGDSPSLGWPRHECGGQQSWLPFPSLNNFLSGLSPAIIGIKMSLREFFCHQLNLSCAPYKVIRCDPSSSSPLASTTTLTHWWGFLWTLPTPQGELSLCRLLVLPWFPILCSMNTGRSGWDQRKLQAGSPVGSSVTSRGRVGRSPLSLVTSCGSKPCWPISSYFLPPLCMLHLIFLLPLQLLYPGYGPKTSPKINYPNEVSRVVLSSVFHLRVPLKSRRCKWSQWPTPVIPAIEEAEAEASCRPAWAT